MKRIPIVLLFIIIFSMVKAERNFIHWSLADDGGISRKVKTGESFSDHIEMSGKQISEIVTYGVQNGGLLVLNKHLVFPMLRFRPNKTRSHLFREFDGKFDPEIRVNGMKLQEKPERFHHKGVITIESRTQTPVTVTRVLFPSVDKAAAIEIYKLKNTASASLEILIQHETTEERTDPATGIYGEYTVRIEATQKGSFVLNPGEEFQFAMICSARRSNVDPYFWSPSWELAKRKKMIDELMENLVLETPNDTINRAFAFAKIRAAESIYDTKGGLMHGPGGGTYYAAIWANDQAEYINPFFPFLGNINGNESAINSFRHFARFMNPEYKPIPSSIISEGVSTWHGAKDRGDMAMIAYGASRFALAYGDRNIAGELWPLIEWSLEYLNRLKSNKGVIFSDSDELENRFENGDYNLATNSLAYGGLVAASRLASGLNKPEAAEIYGQRAANLRTAIEKYFGANVQGFDTYQYYQGNTKLRAWICYPLNVGIFDRKEETMKALFSDYLWTRDGILTESGTETFWDRSTLHAFKGLFAAAATDQTMKYFNYFSAKRLLGDHVPYPVEAWPEGNQRHLSAESGLYCRVVAEGLFGIEPLGFKSFLLKPYLPTGWNYMKLKNIKAFQSDFDVEAYRNGNTIRVLVFQKGRKLFETNWDQKSELKFVLD